MCHVDVSAIENPYKSGACFDCVYHHKTPIGSHLCSDNEDSAFKQCSKVMVCNSFCRKFTAGAPELKSHE